MDADLPADELPDLGTWMRAALLGALASAGLGVAFGGAAVALTAQAMAGRAAAVDAADDADRSDAIARWHQLADGPLGRACLATGLATPLPPAGVAP